MDPASMTAVGTEFIKQGTLGLIIVILLTVVGVLWRKYTIAHEARYTDATAFMDRYVRLLEKTMEAQQDTNNVLEIIKDRVTTSRNTQDLMELIKKATSDKKKG